MRTLMVVGLAPTVELSLHFRRVRECSAPQHLCLQRPVESFLLPLRLRMVRTTMQHADVLSQKPHGQPRIAPRLMGHRPRRSVVRQQRPGKTVTLKHTAEALSDRLRLLIQASPQPQRIPRMGVRDRQCMATTPVRRAEVSLEIHLPQFFRGLPLESLPRSTLGRLLLLNPTMPMQNRRDRAGRWDRWAPQGQQTRPQLAASPRRMAIPQLQHFRFDCWARRLAKMPWTTRTIDTRLSPPKSLQTLVTRLPRNPETAAQHTELRVRQHRQ